MTALALLLMVAIATATSAERQWADFKMRYGRVYASAAEDRARAAVFAANMRAAAALSAHSPSASFGATKFSDMTRAEFAAAYARLNGTAHHERKLSLPPLPRGTPGAGRGEDWVARGLVSSVKNQGTCGNCWAFAAAGAAEGCYAVRRGRAANLSVAQLTDCCTKSWGCEGGDADACLGWAMGQDLATWEDYPFAGAQGQCRAVAPAKAALPSGTCTHYKVEAGEEAMVEALGHSTVTAAIDAFILQYYQGGVLSSRADCDADGHNHAVLVVSDRGKGDSYVVKNSWGEDWGEAGFFRLAKGKNCIGVSDDCSVAF